MCMKHFVSKGLNMWEGWGEVGIKTKTLEGIYKKNNRHKV